MIAESASKIQDSFSRSFAQYDANAVVQLKLAEFLVRKLKEKSLQKSFNCGFEIGCGTGALTRALRAEFDFSELILNDLTTASEALVRDAKMSFLAGDATKISWPLELDLIASSAMIQWVENQQQFFSKAASALRDGGWIALSSFGTEQFSELKSLGSSAQAPGILPLKALLENLEQGSQEQLVIEDSGEDIQQLWFESPLHVLRHLRATGVNVNARNHWTKTDLKRFASEYETRFGTEKGVPLTYHTTWVVARKSG